MIIAGADVFTVHLSVTKSYEGINDLAEMLTRFNKIYVKGCRGSRDNQVFSVAQLPESGYEFRSYVNKIFKACNN